MGVNINLRVVVLILLVVVCYMGYLRVVNEMIKVGVDLNLFNGDIMFLIVICL